MTSRKVTYTFPEKTVLAGPVPRVRVWRVFLRSINWFPATFILLTASATAQQATTLVQGSVPIQETSGTLSLSLDDAIRMALQHNLAEIESIEAESYSRGQRLVALSKLLPTLDGGISEHVIQSSMVPYGIDIPGVPTISGPYQYQDARLNYEQTLFSASSIRSLRSARRTEQAASLSIADSREAIVLITGAAYLRVVQHPRTSRPPLHRLTTRTHYIPRRSMHSMRERGHESMKPARLCNSIRNATTWWRRWTRSP